MTERELLLKVMNVFTIAVDANSPISPLAAHHWRQTIEEVLYPPDTEQRKPTTPPIQKYWRCKHYPSAIDNHFSRDVCEHGCHTVEPTWYSNGESI